MIQVPDSLIEYPVATVIAVAAVGQLPRFTHHIQIATIKLLKDSQSSKWGTVWIPENRATKATKTAKKSKK